MHASVGSAILIDGCSFAECHANNVRLLSNTTPQEPSPQSEAMQIPLLSDYSTRVHTLKHRSKGALMRSEGLPPPVLCGECFRSCLLDGSDLWQGTLEPSPPTRGAVSIRCLCWRAGRCGGCLWRQSRLRRLLIRGVPRRQQCAPSLSHNTTSTHTVERGYANP